MSVTVLIRRFGVELFFILFFVLLFFVCFFGVGGGRGGHGVSGYLFWSSL